MTNDILETSLYKRIEGTGMVYKYNQEDRMWYQVLIEDVEQLPSSDEMDRRLAESEEEP